jgi:hypothetical protein
MSNREEGHESSPSPETVKTELEIEKLRLETDKLRHEGTGFGRLAALILPASQSSITAFVAILGVVISIWSLYQQRISQDKQNHDRALQIAVRARLIDEFRESINYRDFGSTKRTRLS